VDAHQRFEIAERRFKAREYRNARIALECVVDKIAWDREYDLFLKSHYLLGRVCEKLVDQPAAEKHYGEVIVVKYDYEDANDRLTQLQARG
jgi:hypothetical protein